MRIGIIELLLDTVSLSATDRVFGHSFKRQLSSIMPQAIAVWCRRAGHDVFYATYYGQADPKGLLPDDLDVVFVATCTQSSPLACALAKLYRRDGALTVIGGPHAKAFPHSCLPFFDLVVTDCDGELIADILAG
ncbi:MAG: radical SAM protein, partial [Alphaproteobacteria bacterium]|nr:radical SAM protein [Alphaproteobacteria bacterium]